MRRHFHATFASLRVRNYRLYFIGQSVSVVGTWMQKLAQAWLVLELTDSAVWLGAIVAIQEVPTLLLTPWTGLLADRVAKRKILIWAAVGSAVPALALGVLTLSSHITIEIVLALALFLGVMDAVEKPARHAFPSEMVDRENLTNAVSLNNLIQAAGKTVGPAVGGLLIALIDLPATFLVNAVSYAAVVTGLFLMDPAKIDRPHAVRRGRGQFREGLRYVSAKPELLGPLVLLAIVGLFGWNFNVLLPLFARETFGGGADEAGFLLAALGLGSVLGALAFAGTLRPVPRNVILSALCFSALFFPASFSPNLGIAAVMIFFLGGASVLFKILASSWLQFSSDPMMRGRLMSLLVLAMAGTTPFGAPLVGWLVHQWGTRLTFVVAGVFTTVATLSTYVYLRRRMPKGVGMEPAAEVGRHPDGSLEHVGAS